MRAAVWKHLEAVDSQLQPPLRARRLTVGVHRVVGMSSVSVVQGQSIPTDNALPPIILILNREKKKPKKVHYFLAVGSGRQGRPESSHINPEEMV